METADNIIMAARLALPPRLPAGILAASLLAVLLALIGFRGRQTGDKKPQSLLNWKGIPVLGNTLQYMMDNASFISRARCVGSTFHFSIPILLEMEG